jgi:hypothetical protein
MIRGSIPDTKYERMVWEGWFWIDIPSQWKCSEKDGVVSIFNPKGVGTIQISFATRRRKGEPAQSEAIELAADFVRQKGWSVNSEQIRIASISNCPSAVFTYEDRNGIFWQVWHVVGSIRAAFITYNCSKSDVDIEAAERQRIVGSFNWHQP